SRMGSPSEPAVPAYRASWVTLEAPQVLPKAQPRRTVETPSRRAPSLGSSDTREFCHPVRGTCKIKPRQGHRQHPDCQDRTEDSVCLDPTVEFMRLCQIIPPDRVSH